jgi:uncharacterized membrane protein
VATLTVWKFNTATGADEAQQLLQRLQREQLIQIQDAAIVTWPQGDKKPKTRQLTNMAGAGALGGAFWGLLFGLLFFVPILGLAIGAGMGALTGAMTDVGIDDKMINDLRSKITEGTSALFLLSSNAVPDRIAAEVKQLPAHGELIQSNLSAEEEAKLKEIFGDESAESTSTTPSSTPSTSS